MSTFAPVPSHELTARMIINTGNENVSAACPNVASEILAYQVSTTLYMVLKKNPTEAGIAIWRMRRGMESEVRFKIQD